MKTTIWHNPKCSKSRATLALLESHGMDPHIRLYLTDPPSTSTIESVLSKLGLSARGLMRKKEALYSELSLEAESLTEEELIQAMAQNPSLIERPVVIRGAKAAIGRPPDAVLNALK
jgi:arsenate reductase (glutaredoxin)